MSILKCPACGAKVDNNDTTHKVIECKYCGTSIENTNYVEPKVEPIENTQINQSDTNNRQNHNSKDTKLNGCLLVALLFIFWPAGIGYLIYCISKNKN